MRSFSAVAYHFAHDHHWLAMAEHAVLRCLMLTAGVALVVLGLGLGVTLIMLPVGIVMALAGVGLMVGAVDKDLPLPPDA